jgi:hypothetical protein
MLGCSDGDGSIAPAPREKKLDGACHEMQVRGRRDSALDWTKEELECSTTACTHAMYCMLDVGLCVRARRGMEGLIDLKYQRGVRGLLLLPNYYCSIIILIIIILIIIITLITVL